MSGGFLSRFRPRRDAEKPSDGTPSPAHEATHTQQQDDASAEETLPGMPDKVASGDLPAEGNDVAMEEMTIAHEGLQLDQSQGGSPTLAQYAINGNSPGMEGGSDDVAAEEGGAEDTAQKFTLFKEDGVPLRAETSLDPAEGTQDSDALTSPGPDGQAAARWNFTNAWPSKVSGPQTNSDSDLPGEPDELRTADSDSDPIAIEKVEIAVEKVEPPWSAAQAPDDLAPGGTGDDAATREFYEGLITKTTIPAAEPEDLEPQSTLQPLNETEGDGLTLLTTNLRDNLDDAPDFDVADFDGKDDDNPDVDDLT
jgi:hypothetical protein